MSREVWTRTLRLGGRPCYSRARQAADAGGSSDMRAGDTLPLTIEKAAAGGRMLARHDGQVVLVAGAIPGERVQARIDQVKGGVAFGVDSRGRDAVARPPFRRAPIHRAAETCSRTSCTCGSSHSSTTSSAMPSRESRTFRCRTSIPAHPSPERGYRMRARLHVHGDRLGFYREGTHTLCDPARDRAIARLDARRRAGGLRRAPIGSA